jgi:hypothetical protein
MRAPHWDARGIVRAAAVAAVNAAAAVCISAGARALEVNWFTVDAGGGRSIAANLALTGTIGQPEGGASNGGTFAVRGGFWAPPGETATGVDPDGAMDAATPREFRLSASRPNPFRGSTSLQLEMPSTSHASIRVYDVSGRLVRTLVDGGLDAGIHEIGWDGRDTNGQLVASGVYLVRMQAAQFGATRKIVRLD